MTCFHTYMCISYQTDPHHWCQRWTISPTHFPCSLTPSREFHLTLSSLSLSFHPVCPLLFIHSLPSSPLPLSSHFVFSWFSAWPHLWRRIITKWGHCVLTVIFEVSNSLTFASLFCSGLSVGNLPMFPFSPIVSLSDPHAYIGPHWDWFRNQE